MNSQFLTASVNEFISVWALQGNASLSLTTSNGKANVSFNCTLGHPSAPHSLPPFLPSSPPHHQPRHRGPSERERNRERAARHQATMARPASPVTPLPSTAPARPVITPTSALTASVTSSFNTASVASSQTKHCDKIPQIDGHIEDSAKEESIKQDLNFQCNHCEHKTTEETELLQHVKVYHDGLKCDYCKYKNSSKDKIKEHMKKTHKDGWNGPRNSSPVRTCEETHLPTADDPDNIFECYIKQLDQEKIENMSKSDIIQLTAEIARKNALRDESKIAKKE